MQDLLILLVYVAYCSEKQSTDTMINHDDVPFSLSCLI